MTPVELLALTLHECGASVAKATATARDQMRTLERNGFRIAATLSPASDALVKELLAAADGAEEASAVAMKYLPGIELSDAPLLKMARLLRQAAARLGGKS